MLGDKLSKNAERKIEPLFYVSVLIDKKFWMSSWVMFRGQLQESFNFQQYFTFMITKNLF